MAVRTPVLIPPPYFEHQRLNHCTIHACNNALGKKLVTLTAINGAANRMAAEAAARTRARQQESATKDPTRSRPVLQTLRQLERLHLQPLAGPLGDFSPDVAFRILQEHGIYAHRASGRMGTFPAGQWVIQGTVTYPHPHDVSQVGGTYAHRVAVRDGWWLDSEQNGPVQLPADGSLPVYFSPWSMYRLSTDPPSPPQGDRPHGRHPECRSRRARWTV